MAVIACFFAGSPAAILHKTYFELAKAAEDILVVKVRRIEGRPYQLQAIAQIDESLKGVLRGDSIALPFAYKKYPDGDGVFLTAADAVPVTFEAGKSYVVMLQNHSTGTYDPSLANTKYEVLQYPDKAYFEIGPNTKARLELLRAYAKILKSPDAQTTGQSLSALLASDSAFARIDVLEELDELKYANPSPALKLLQNDPDAGVRAAAALELRHASDSATADAMIDYMLKEPSSVVINKVVSSLDRSGARRAVPIFLMWYDTSRAELQNSILEFLSRARDTSAADSLIRFYNHEHDRDRRAALLTDIAVLRCARADKFSYGQLKTNNDPRAKAAIIQAWGESGYTQAFKSILGWGNYPWPKPKRGSIADSSSIDVLEFAVLDAIQQLGTPEQILSAFPRYRRTKSNDRRTYILSILNSLLQKDLSPDLRLRTKDMIHKFGGK
jgi:HEAT repeat protein